MRALPAIPIRLKEHDMRLPGLALVLLLTSLSAAADDAADCRAGAGAYLSGTVVGAPKFAHGRFRKGVELSHTHLRLHADQDGKVYDVAIDNVFATGYHENERAVPAPLDAIRVNDRLEVCGALYARGDGIHWVHPTCGGRPNPQQPDGWLRRVARDGRAGPNDESNMSYCPLFKGGFRAQ
jgi:hypothetical protein